MPVTPAQGDASHVFDLEINSTRNKAMDHPLPFPSLPVSKLPNGFSTGRDTLGERQIMALKSSPMPSTSTSSSAATDTCRQQTESVVRIRFGFREHRPTSKPRAARNYKGTYDRLVKRLCTGRLLHADETKVNVKNKGGFVWVFANMEEVAYVYSGDTRGRLASDLAERLQRRFGV